MKTAIQSVMDIIEMEHNNGVEISQRVLWKMLNEAKKTEKQHIINFGEKMQLINKVDFDGNVTFTFDPVEHFEQTFKNE